MLKALENVIFNNNVFHLAGSKSRLLAAEYFLAVIFNDDFCIFISLTNSEEEFNVIFVLNIHFLRDNIANTVDALCLYIFMAARLAEDLSCSTFAGRLAFKGNIVYKVVNVENVAAGKNAFV